MVNHEDKSSWEVAVNHGSGGIHSLPKAWRMLRSKIQNALPYHSLTKRGIFIRQTRQSSRSKPLLLRVSFEPSCSEGTALKAWTYCMVFPVMSHLFHPQLTHHETSKQCPNTTQQCTFISYSFVYPSTMECVY